MANLKSTKQCHVAWRDKALACLARREHSQLELRMKLLKQGMPSDQVAELISVLAAEGLQSDARYTEMLVRTRMHQGIGPVRIMLESKQKGINPAAVEPLLAEIDWSQALIACWQKKYNARYPANAAEFARMQRFLLFRGYAAESVYRLLSSKTKL